MGNMHGFAVAHEGDREPNGGSRKLVQLAHFAEQLKQLHRLSTTRYDSLDRAFEDHLKTGCELFGLPIGMILRAEGDAGIILAADGSPDFCAGVKLRLSATHCARVADRLRTITSSKPDGNCELRPEFEICIGTPILVGGEMFGTLLFSSSFKGEERKFLDA